MIRSKNTTWLCDGCGGHATKSCGHGLPVCIDCDPTGICGACYWDRSEAGAA